MGWGDPWGALVYAVFGRLVFVHHSTFFVNSLAHYLGVQPYSDLHRCALRLLRRLRCWLPGGGLIRVLDSAFDSVVTALVSLGEGYHNYHHEFPQDYRNGIKWYHFDPTKVRAWRRLRFPQATLSTRGARGHAAVVHHAPLPTGPRVQPPLG